MTALTNNKKVLRFVEESAAEIDLLDAALDELAQLGTGQGIYIIKDLPQ